MKVKYMTLEGETDREKFIAQWQKSHQSEATFLLAGDILYVMPYGTYEGGLDKEKVKQKFAGTYRRHTFVMRDFEIPKGSIKGGGYLRLNPDRTCKYTVDSTDFGAVPDASEVVQAVTREILQGMNSNESLEGKVTFHPFCSLCDLKNDLKNCSKEERERHIAEDICVFSMIKGERVYAMRAKSFIKRRGKEKIRYDRYSDGTIGEGRPAPSLYGY